MIVLALGIALFTVFHLVPVVPGAEGELRKKIGDTLYRPVYILGSLFGLMLIVVGWRASPFVAVYEPAWWGRFVNFGLTAIAFICLGTFAFRGYLRQVLRYPLAIGVMFWAVGHLFANGDLASLILFGGFLLYGALHLILGLRSGLRPSAEVRNGHDLLAIFFGLALYGVMTQLHPIVTGVPVFDLGS